MALPGWTVKPRLEQFRLSIDHQFGHKLEIVP
jgi:hypothetical protein